MKQMMIGCVIATFLATAATAHSGVENTNPARDATVQTVEVIEMHFDEPMRVTSITLTGQGGEVTIERETGMDAVTEFRALPPADLPAGAYTVDWRGLSSDGHPMQGTFGFTVAD